MVQRLAVPLLAAVVGQAAQRGEEPRQEVQPRGVRHSGADALVVQPAEAALPSAVAQQAVAV